MKRITLCSIAALVVSTFGLTACGGNEAQQQPDRQGSQPGPPPAQSSNNVPSGLIGTWEETDTGLGGLLTLSEDGTFQTQPLPSDDPDLILSGEYSVDNSRITFLHPEEGAANQVEYSLEGDTLTTRTYVEDPEFPIDQVSTYKRKS